MNPVYELFSWLNTDFFAPILSFNIPLLGIPFSYLIITVASLPVFVKLILRWFK